MLPVWYEHYFSPLKYGIFVSFHHGLNAVGQLTGSGPSSMLPDSAKTHLHNPFALALQQSPTRYKSLYMRPTP